MLPQDGDDRVQRKQSVSEQRPDRSGLRRLVECLEHALLDLRAHAAERAQALRLRRSAELGDRRHAELAPDPGRRLRAETGEPHEQRDLRRHTLLALRQRVDLAVVDDLDDLRLDRLSDPLQTLGAPVESELGDGAARLADPGRGAAVRRDAEGVFAAELHQVGEEVEL